MKAPRRNLADIMVYALLSVGALSLSLLSLGRFDLIMLEPFGSTMVRSLAVSSFAASAIMYEYGRAQAVLHPQHARIRR